MGLQVSWGQSLLVGAGLSLRMGMYCTTPRQAQTLRKPLLCPRISCLSIFAVGKSVVESVAEDPTQSSYPPMGPVPSFLAFLQVWPFRLFPGSCLAGLLRSRLGLITNQPQQRFLSSVKPSLLEGLQNQLTRRTPHPYSHPVLEATRIPQLQTSLHLAFRFLASQAQASS